MKKNYYAIIPANVRYDKDLNANAKLLYGEITALANEKGYCWAGNNYFSNLYDVSQRTIIRWINDLVVKGYLASELIYKNNSKEVLERRLWVVSEFQRPHDKNVTTSCQECHEPHDKNVTRGTDKNVTDNNTSFNNTSNITRDISNNVEQSPTTQIPYKEIVDYLNQKLGTQYRATSKKTRKLIKARFDDDFTLDDFKTVIDKKVYQWQGTQFSDFLRPDTLFSSKFEGYLNQQVMGYNNAGFSSTHGDYDSSGRQLL